MRGLWRNRIASAATALSSAATDLLDNRYVAALRSHWRTRYGLLIVAIGAAVVAFIQINTPDKAPDFTVFHAAATHAFGPVYDSDYLTPLQHTTDGPRPFAYPPTFLLLLQSIAWLPFKTAYVAWVALSVTAYVAAGVRMTKWSWLAIYSPTLLFAALIGQTTLIVGALAITGLLQSGRRPMLAGIVIALAASIKPQLLLLVPVALAWRRDWSALGFAAATGVALVAATSIMFGVHIWGEWLSSLDQFVAINDRLDIKRLGVPLSWVLTPAILLIAIGLIRAAAKVDDLPRMIVATLGGGMLLSPHSAFYESCILIAPALASAGLGWRLLPSVYLLCGGAVTPATLAATTVALAAPIGKLSPCARPRRRP